MNRRSAPGGAREGSPRLEGTFPDGTRLVPVHHFIEAELHEDDWRQSETDLRAVVLGTSQAQRPGSPPQRKASSSSSASKGSARTWGGPEYVTSSL